jgi:hypothetical protein
VAPMVPGPAVAATTSACAQAVPVHRANCLSILGVGHRGKLYLPDSTNENTLAALRVDYLLGAGCESDTWRLAADDGTPNQGASVILHDDELGRVVSAGSLAAAGLTASTTIGHVTRAKFDMLRTKGGEPLPTLYTWIKYASRHRVNCKIEVKWPVADAVKVRAWIAAYNGYRYISFYAKPRSFPAGSPCSLDRLTPLREAGVRVGVKTSKDCFMYLSSMHNQGYTFVAANQGQLTAAYIARAHRYGLKVGNKSSGSRTLWANLVRRDADYIIAPYPRTLMRWLGQ